MGTQSITIVTIHYIEHTYKPIETQQEVYQREEHTEDSVEGPD